MSKDDENKSLRDEVENLKSIIKDLSKKVSEAYKGIDTPAEDFPETDEDEGVDIEIKDDSEEAFSSDSDSFRKEAEKQLDEDLSRIKADKEHLHRDSLRHPRPHPRPQPQPHPSPPSHPPHPPHPPDPFFSRDDFDFTFDSKVFEEKMKNLKKFIDKTSKEGEKIASKISEKISKEVNKFLEKETAKLSKVSELSAEDFEDLKQEIDDARQDLEDSQNDVEDSRSEVDEARRMLNVARYRLNQANRERDVDEQIEASQEFKEAEKEVSEAMNNLVKARGELAQVKREFARLLRRAYKIRAAQSGHGPRVIGIKDFDYDGTISEYVSKVVNSVGKNLQSTLRSAFGDSKKTFESVIRVKDEDDENRAAFVLSSECCTTPDELEEFLEEAANLLSALGDSNRLKLLKILEKSPQYQKELSEITDLKGGTFKHHTDILQNEQFITREAIRGRYLITQLGIEALKIAEMIYLRKKRLEEENIEDEDEEDIDDEDND
jgi:hypothetical protein